MMLSNLAEDSIELLSDLEVTVYVPSSWRVSDVTAVESRTSALLAFAICSKISQLPPTTAMAPSVAMEHMVSSPWIKGRF